MADKQIDYINIIRETKLAIYVATEGGGAVWLPKSEIHIDEEDLEITMPEWLFKDKFPFL